MAFRFGVHSETLTLKEPKTVNPWTEDGLVFSEQPIEIGKEYKILVEKFDDGS